MSCWNGPSVDWSRMFWNRLFHLSQRSPFVDQTQILLNKQVSQSYLLTLFDMGGGSRSPPWKVFKMPNFDVVMTPTMSRNIFAVIWKFWKRSNFWVILESLLQLKRNFDHFKSWNYPFLCVWWVTKSFELIKVPEVCFPGGGSFSPPSCQMHQKISYVK